MFKQARRVAADPYLARAVCRAVGEYGAWVVDSFAEVDGGSLVAELLDVLGAGLGMVGAKAGEQRVEKVPGSYLAAAEGYAWGRREGRVGLVRGGWGSGRVHSK